MNERDRFAFWLAPVAAFVAPVHAADYLSVEQAERVLFPTAQTFTDVSVALTREQKDQIKALSGMRQRWDTQRIWRAEAGGDSQGWFIVDEVIG